MGKEVLWVLFTSSIVFPPMMMCYYSGKKFGVNPYISMFAIQFFLYPLFQNSVGIEEFVVAYLYIIPVVLGIFVAGWMIKKGAKLLGIDIEKVDNLLFPKVERKGNIFQKVSAILSGIFLPLIPLMVMRGVLAEVSRHDPRLLVLEEFGKLPFYFLPIYIGVGAADELKLNLWFGGWLGTVLICYSPLYEGSIFPVLLTMGSIYLIRYRLKRKKFYLDWGLILLSIVLLPPLGLKMGDGVAFAIIYIFNHMGILAGTILGGTYSTIVATGLHQGIVMVETGLLQKLGYNFLLPIWAVADIGQGGAAFAVALKETDKKKKKMATAAAAASLWGLSEAAMFWINLKYFTPFLAGCIGAALGGTYMVFASVVMTGMGLSGIPGIILVRYDKIYSFVIGCSIALITSFLLTLLIYKKIKEDPRGK